MAARRGFNLLETILGFALFASVTAAMLGVWVGYTRMSAGSRSLLVASHLAENLMETQMHLGWQAESIPPSPENVFRMVQIVDDTETEIEYAYRVEVTDLSDPPNLGLKQVVVFVTWEETGGRKEVRLESLLYWGS